LDNQTSQIASSQLLVGGNFRFGFVLLDSGGRRRFREEIRDPRTWLWTSGYIRWQSSLVRDGRTDRRRRLNSSSLVRGPSRRWNRTSGNRRRRGRWWWWWWRCLTMGNHHDEHSTAANPFFIQI